MPKWIQKDDCGCGEIECEPVRPISKNTMNEIHEDITTTLCSIHVPKFQIFTKDKQTYHVRYGYKGCQDGAEAWPNGQGDLYYGIPLGR